MRWVVEASSIGKTDAQTFVIESESWEHALKEARAQRGEEGPMSGFSIELLEEGYRAVDPVARVRFVVKRAPDTAGAPNAPQPAPPVAASPLLPVGAAVPGLPAIQLLSSREQDPTEASPISYREYAFGVPVGTSEDVAVKVLRSQLGLVDRHLASAKMGKLVNLAVFDVEPTGKPSGPPLATLVWKDWKGEPILDYPRRSASERPPMPADAPSAASAPPSASASFPPPASVPPPASPASVPPPAPHPSAPPPAAKASVPPAASDAAAPEPAQHPSSPDAMVLTPSGRFVRGRTTGEELIPALFESMHELRFLHDALDGGHFCLALATEVLPARAALVHFFDIEKREWVTACTRGKDTARLLTLEIPESDELLREATRKRHAIVAEASATAQRYQSLGGVRSLIIAPVMQAGRALGAIEIVNPLDGMSFNEDEANAMTYIAEQYAEYLGSRGIVLDRARIRAAASRT